MRVRRVAGDRGESLIEVLVALLVLGTAAVAIMSGIALSIKVSDLHRKEANASAYVRNYAEWIETSIAGGGYAAGTASYGAYSPPSGYLASMPAKQCWTTASTWTTCTSGNDIGVQRLTLRVSSSDGRAAETLVVVVRKPCAPGQTTCT